MGKDGKRKTPAASSKAADFLQSASSSASMSSFGAGFTFGSTTPSAGVGMVDDFASLDPELRVLLKKMSKRDPTTKSKALDDILALLKSNTALMETFVPLWVSWRPLNQVSYPINYYYLMIRTLYSTNWL